MLKAVVQDQHLAFQLLDRCLGQGDPIGPLQVRHVGQVLFQHQRLVIGAALAAVAAAEDGHAPVPFAIEARHVLHARRLAGAADSQVADADDRASPLGGWLSSRDRTADCGQRMAQP